MRRLIVFQKKTNITLLTSEFPFDNGFKFYIIYLQISNNLESGMNNFLHRVKFLTHLPNRQ
jgi:hypothetical protein